MSSSCNNGGDAKVLAIILDLDGTLLNTEKATKDILKEFLEIYGKVVDRDKEDKRLGMMHMESVTSIVKDYDLPLTPQQFSTEIMPLYHQKWPLAKPLPGVNRLILHLRKHGVPFALGSNSITINIENKISHQHGWKEAFSTVVGSDQVKFGKPSPDIFLEAAKRIGIDPAHCLVIEDSVVGVMAAKAAGMKVVAVPSLKAQADTYSSADYVLHSLLEFQPELLGLPAFDDWVGNALPIEPLYVKGRVRKGVMCEVSDDGPNALPDQASGIFFGWAKLQTHGISKVVVEIGWQGHSWAAKRIIKPHFFGELGKCVSGEKIQIVLVGYIRALNQEVSEMESDVVEEDRSIACEALDLPNFSHDMSDPILDEAI
ncbi:hypothetical protein ACHQM5_003944 [Ranunculus cassubicifolius]